MSGANPASILVVDDEKNIRESIQQALQKSGHAVAVSADAAEAERRLEEGPVDLVLCDVRLPGTGGLELLGRIKERHPATLVIMITGFASIESAVDAIRHGAADYLPKPFNAEQVRHAVARGLSEKRLRDENLYLRERLTRASVGERAFVAESAAMKRVFETARAVAAADSGVLVTGPSGAGKEVVAHFIHAQGPRAAEAFVAINCAAIPATLLESELFGHTRGAFTGATHARRGCFELADGGTLLLDEIGEMAVEMQAKLLRALEERRIRRIGSEEAVAVNVRIVAATNKDLEAEVRAGRFREDVFWRLNVVQIAVPGLAERRDDILPLARHFLAAFGRDQKKPIPDFSDEVALALQRYDWPGNVRELRNAVERAVIFAEPGEPLRIGHLPPHLRPVLPPPASPSAFRSLREMELAYIEEVLAAYGGNRARAAEVLGLSPVTLWRKLGPESAPR